jgi:branched-chain amino acid transport system permease protein
LSDAAAIAALRRFALPAVILLVLALGPLIFTEFFLGQILTKALWLGIAAASLTFLAGYGGMISLAQAALYGIAGFTMANVVASDGGQRLEWNPWLGVVLGIFVATLVGLLLGAVASRSEGIYFLMLTLAMGILTFYFFGQVNDLSGFGGLNRVDLPDFLGNPVKEPNTLYYTAFVAAVVIYVVMRYLVRTPFGLSLQGILSVWWNTQISPGSIDLGRAIDILIIAVVGGLYRIEGAWLGAIVFVVIENWSRTKFDFIGANQRFNTVIAGLFLVIVLLSPGGLIGIIERINAGIRGRLGGGGMSGPPEPSPQESSA